MSTPVHSDPLAPVFQALGDPAIPEVAKRLGLGINNAYGLVARGALPANGWPFRVRCSQLEDFIEARIRRASSAERPTLTADKRDGSRFAVAMLGFSSVTGWD